VKFSKVRVIAFGAAFAAVCAAATLQSNEASAAQCGTASWYSTGTKTANGERMNASALAAAHRTLPFGTRVRVDNLANGRSVEVRINDRGPFVGGRVIDLTRGAAEQIGMIHSGTASVRVTVLEGSKKLTGCS
jgi:peptidoglycan lytic transglycosylase